mgnify:CR=1 FL=1
MNVDRVTREGIIIGIFVTPTNGSALCDAVLHLRRQYRGAHDGELLERVLMAGVSFLQLRDAEGPHRRESIVWHRVNEATPPVNESVLMSDGESVWIGFIDGDRYLGDGGITTCPTAWAAMPRGFEG